MPSFRITLGLLVTGLLLLIAFIIAVPRDAATNAYGYGPTPLLKNAAEPTPDTSPRPLGGAGFGVLGDSNSDEYRADDDRGSEPWRETTLNFVELLARHRGLDFGPWGTRPEPRRTGYAYNWARTSATAASMISSGQHTGLAAQIRSSEVSYAFIWIGTNDFAPGESTPYSYEDIYSGAVQGDELIAFLDTFVDHMRTAADTLLEAQPTLLVMANMPDYGELPRIVATFPDPTGRQRFSDAMDYVNERLQALADSHENAVLMTHDNWIDSYAEASAQPFWEIAGVQVDMVNTGDAPTHFLLSDAHLGTIANGVMANLLFLPAFNDVGELGIGSFSDEEVVTNAGLVIPVDSDSSAPARYLALRSYPNPTSKVTTVEFTLPKAGFVSLKVFDLRGREVTTVVADELSAGPHAVEVDVSAWPAGTYVYRLKYGSLSSNARFTVVR